MSQIGYRIDRLTWVRFRRAVSTLLASEVGGRARLFVASLVLGLLAINVLNVVNSYVGRDFMTSIESRDRSGVIRFGLLYLLVFAASPLVAVLQRFVEERLGLLWRKWLTNLMVHSYLADHVYFRLGGEPGVSNPDQRIAEDIRSFSTTTLSFVLMLSNGALTAIAFSGVLWSISPILFGVAIAYAALGSLFTIWLARPLVRLSSQQSDREADFRSDLIHVRENADLLALLHREERLTTRLVRHLDALVENAKRMIALNRRVGFFSTGYNYLIQIIPVLIVAPLYFRGQVEFGVITQSAMAFSALVGAISIVITQFQQISNFAAVVGRLSVLSEAIDHIHLTPRSPIELMVDDDRIAFHHLDLSAGDGRPLIRDLEIEIPATTRLVLVVGNSLARTALYRTLAGLWPHGSGQVARPKGERTIFVTERPYLPPGTLREVLVRLWDQDLVSDQRILNALEAVGARSVLDCIGGLDVEHSCGEQLSLGEQQLVALARVLLAAPRFALLDRPSSALTESERNHMLAVLAVHSISVVVFENTIESGAGSSPSAVLTLHDDATWTYGPPHDPHALAEAGG
jgi:putative ATP-binding cassette transporter